MKKIEVTDYAAQEIEFMREEENYTGKMCQLAKAMSAIIFVLGDARCGCESIDVDGCFDALDLLGRQVVLYNEFVKKQDADITIHFEAVGANRKE